MHDPIITDPATGIRYHVMGASQSANCRLTASGLPAGTNKSVTVSGFTGNWTSVNGSYTGVTIINGAGGDNVFDTGVDSTAFGAPTPTL